MPVIPRSRVGLMPAPTPSSGAGLFWWPKYDRSRYHHAGGKAHCGDQPPRKLKIIKNVNNFLYSPYGLCYLLLVVTTRFALHLKSYPKQKNSVLQSNRYCIISVPSPVMMEHMIDACWFKLMRTGSIRKSQLGGFLRHKIGPIYRRGWMKLVMRRMHMLGLIQGVSSDVLRRRVISSKWNKDWFIVCVFFSLLCWLSGFVLFMLRQCLWWRETRVPLLSVLST